MRNGKESNEKMKGKFFCLLLLLLFSGPSQASEPACGAVDTARVRNLIYMIGDGMGLAQVSMLQIEGDYAPTAFERAQGIALIGTRSANNRVTDSAAAATALSSACKTDNGTLGLDPEGRRLTSMMERAVAEGMPTGLAVKCYLQHATPAGFYAHVADRGEYEEITRQMLPSGIDVLIGVDRRRWLAEEAPEGGSYGDAFRRRGYAVAETLDGIDTVRTGRLLCVAAEESVPVEDRGEYLSRVTRKALEVLSANAAQSGRGFMLMVEGSHIDGAGHGNDAKALLAEMRDFERAVAAAMDYADRTPGTLVVVTADHETGGLSISSNQQDFTLSESGLHYGFGTQSHSATMVPVYLYGTGAGCITGVMDNTELSRRIMQLLALE